jgi:hypothetical protein
MTRTHRIIVGAVVATASMAYALRSQVPNVAPASFSDLLRSATGRQVLIAEGMEEREGTLSSVNGDYLTIITSEKVELQIPFSSISHTKREGRTGELGIVLR